MSNYFELFIFDGPVLGSPLLYSELEGGLGWVIFTFEGWCVVMMDEQAWGWTLTDKEH